MEKEVEAYLERREKFMRKLKNEGKSWSTSTVYSRSRFQDGMVGQRKEPVDTVEEMEYAAISFEIPDFMEPHVNQNEETEEYD